MKSDNLRELNRNLLIRGKEINEVMTPVLQNICEAFDVKLYDVDLKSEEQIGENIYRLSEQENRDAEYIERKTTDTCKYIIILDEENFKDNFYAINRELNNLGSETTRIVNNFGKDEPFWCVQATISNYKLGSFEIEFHTKESLEIKEEINRTIYENYEDGKINREDFDYLKNEMISYNKDYIKIPEHVKEITEPRDQLKDFCFRKELLEVYTKNKLIEDYEIINSFETISLKVEDRIEDICKQLGRDDINKFKEEEYFNAETCGKDKYEEMLLEHNSQVCKQERENEHYFK